VRVNGTLTRWVYAVDRLGARLRGAVYLAFTVLREYTLFSLWKRSNGWVGASPLFCCRTECIAYRHRAGSL
jgi:hypothetical protein